MNQKDKIKARLVYMLLFLISLAIPALHYTVACDAMRSTRRITFGLTSAPHLFVNWFGELATAFPFILLILIASSWRTERVLKPGTLCGIAAALLVFATAYGTWCCFLLSWVTKDYVRLVIEQAR